MSLPDTASSSIEAGEPIPERNVLHWYDFLCPFCYVSQGRNNAFERHGFRVIDMAFEVHPEVPAAGQDMPERKGPMYVRLEAEAKAANLPLVWPARLPNTRMALGAAEWARVHAPQEFPLFLDALFAAHFALGEDLGDRTTIAHHAADCGIDSAAMTGALADGTAYALLTQSEALARRAGVRGTPTWLVAGRIVSGLYSEAEIEQLARASTAA